MPATTRSPTAALVLALLASHATPIALAASADDDSALSAAPSLAQLWQRTLTLGTLEQGVLQSERDFLLEAAALIDAFTAAIAAEVCGVFERSDDGTRLLITLMTQGSPAFCMNRRAALDGEAQGELEGLSIHSHVGPRARRADPTCRHPLLDRPVLPIGSPAERVARLLGDRFSEMDIEAGPGFMVHRGRLWHQRGWGTQRLVARIDGRVSLQDDQALADALVAAWMPDHDGVTNCA